MKNAIGRAGRHVVIRLGGHANTIAKRGDMSDLSTAKLREHQVDCGRKMESSEEESFNCRGLHSLGKQIEIGAGNYGTR